MRVRVLYLVQDCDLLISWKHPKKSQFFTRVHWPTLPVPPKTLRSSGDFPPRPYRQVKTTSSRNGVGVCIEIDMY